MFRFKGTAVLHFSSKVLLFLQIIVVVGVPLVLWRTFRLGRILPLPIIQIFAGVALGPSFFGAFAPDAYKFLFGDQVLNGVNTFADISVVMFVFLAGCEADRNILRNSAGTVLRIAIAGVATPWILGALAVYALLQIFPDPHFVQRLIGPSVHPTLYAVAFGLAMSVTALPVLVVVLRELGFIRKPIGSIALAIGGFDDAMLWLSISVLLPFAAGGHDFWQALALAAGGGIVTFLVSAYIVMPFLQRLIDREAPERLLMSSVILMLFIAAATTEVTGLHAVVGAFIVGVLLPDKLRHMAESKLDVPVSLLLLPFFFLATGLKTRFNMADPQIWAMVGFALVVCVGGKFVGITLPSIFSGQSRAFSITLGVLMQCKGLMEIVVVTVLYQRNIIGELTFSSLVLTALISTVLTAPLARLCVHLFGDAATATTAPPRKIEISVIEPATTARATAPATAAPQPAPVPAETPATAPAAMPEPMPAAAETGPLLEFEEDVGTVPMGKAEVVIGRHSQDDIRVRDVRVSRHHARLKRLADGRVELTNLTADRSEPNPVTVNGIEREHAVLVNGDKVSLGGVVFTLKLAA